MSTVPSRRPALPEEREPADPAASARDIRAPRPLLVARLASREAYRRAVRVVALLAIDLAGISAAIFTTLALEALAQGDYGTAGALDETSEYLPFAFLVAVLLFARAGLYGPREARPGAARIVAALVGATAIALVYALVSGTEVSTAWLFPGGLVFASLYIGSLRWGYEKSTGWMLSSMGYRWRTVLVGSGRRIEAVAGALDEGHSIHETVGYLALDGTPELGVRDLGDLRDLAQRIDQHAIEEVIIADPDFPPERAARLVDVCQARGVRVRVAPSTMELLTQRAELVPGGGVPLFEVRAPVFEGLDFVVKRSFDFVIAGLGLLVVSPLLATVALLVKLTSPGPVLHRSLRPGIGARPFNCLKFRTMYEDAEERQTEFEHLNEADGAIFKIREDPRLTPVGRFLRRNSLDELPQLLNVIRGEMSLVGPRPLPLRDHARLEDWHRRRYLVLPGITGLWQVSGRSDLDFDDMVRLDFLYLESWSVMLDLVILLKTLPAVVRRRGAY